MSNPNKHKQLVALRDLVERSMLKEFVKVSPFLLADLIAKLEQTQKAHDATEEALRDVRACEQMECARAIELQAKLELTQKALEEACEAIRFVAASWNNGLLEISAQDETSHEIVERSLDNIKGLLARIKSLERGNK